MFLRANRRCKDGKAHRYFSVLESRRLATGLVVQRAVLYLGEINDNQEASWRKSLAVFDEAQQSSITLSLFPEDREIPAEAVNGLQVKLNETELHRPRVFGNCWLGCELWGQLGLEEFWQEKLGEETKREWVPWEKVLRLLVVNRLIDPGSEFRIHRQWFEQSAMGELLETDFAVAEKVQLTQIEATFKALKSELGIRPIYHQLEHRMEVHILVAFLAYCLTVTLKQRLQALAPGLTPRAVFEKLATIQMLDVCFPTTDGRWLVMPRYTQPEPEQQLLLHRLKLSLPPQPPPRLKAQSTEFPAEAPSFVVDTFRRLLLKNKKLTPPVVPYCESSAKLQKTGHLYFRG